VLIGRLCRVRIAPYAAEAPGNSAAHQQTCPARNTRRTKSRGPLPNARQANESKRRIVAQPGVDCLFAVSPRIAAAGLGGRAFAPGPRQKSGGSII